MNEKTLSNSINNYDNNLQISYAKKGLKRSRENLKDFIKEEGYLENVKKARQAVIAKLYSSTNSSAIDANLKNMKIIRDEEEKLLTKYSNFYYKRGVGRIGWQLEKERHHRQLSQDDQKLLQLIRSYNSQKGQLRKNIDIKELYHSVNKLRETILQIPELQYKVIVVGAEDKNLYEITGEFQDLVNEKIIVAHGQGKKQYLSYGNTLFKKLENTKLNIRKIEGLTYNESILRQVNKELSQQDQNKARIDDIIKGIAEIERDAPLAKQFDILFAYINAERGRASLNMGQLFEAYYHYSSIRGSKKGEPKADDFIKSIRKSINNADWLSGGDVILGNVDYQIKVMGGNTTPLQQVQRFAEEILVLSDFYNTVSIQDINSNTIDNQIDKILKTLSQSDSEDITDFGQQIENIVNKVFDKK